MTIRASDVLFIGGGVAVRRFGALSWRTSPAEDSPEVHTRAAAANFVDPNGDTKQAGADVPRVEWIDDDSDGVRETPTLLLGTTDLLYFPWPRVPVAMSVYLDFDQLALMSAAAGVLHIGDAVAGTDPRFVVQSNGTFFQAVHDNGTTVVTATLAAAPSQNDRVEILAILKADGSLTIEQSVNQAASTTASDATTATLGAAWADRRLYINSTGSTGAGDARFRSIKAVRGIQTLAAMRSLFA